MVATLTSCSRRAELRISYCYIREFRVVCMLAARGRCSFGAAQTRTRPVLSRSQLTIFRSGCSCGCGHIPGRSHLGACGSYPVAHRPHAAAAAPRPIQPTAPSWCCNCFRQRSRWLRHACATPRGDQHWSRVVDTTALLLIAKFFWRRSWHCRRIRRFGRRRRIVGVACLTAAPAAGLRSGGKQHWISRINFVHVVISIVTVFCFCFFALWISPKPKVFFTRVCGARELLPLGVMKRCFEELFTFGN